MKRIYLDHAATTPTDPEVVQAMLPYFTDAYGNPSSIHSLGQETKAATGEARDRIAALIGAHSDEIVFTSGGTEADNFALKGLAYASQYRGNHIVTTSIEHHAVLESCKFLEKQGFEVTYLPVDKHGLVDPEAVKKAITDKTMLVSVMHANNEIGTIEPISEIGKITHERGVYFHTDAVQTLGHTPVNVDDLGVDLLSMSAHKLSGPKGIGALYIRKGTRISPFMLGGAQERGRRASTENVPAIVGFGKAVELAEEEMGEEMTRLTSLRDELVRGLFERVDHIHLNGHPSLRLPNNVNITVEFAEGESMAISLDLEGIAVSTGSACSSDALEPSHVLLALGVPGEMSHCSLRFTLGRGTSREDIDRVLEVFPRVVSRLRSMSPLLRGKA